MYQMGRNFCLCKFCSYTGVYILFKSVSLHGSRVCTESVHMFRSNVWVVGSPVFESILVCNNCEFSKLKIEFFLIVCCLRTECIKLIGLEFSGES